MFLVWGCEFLGFWFGFGLEAQFVSFRSGFGLEFLGVFLPAVRMILPTHGRSNLDLGIWGSKKDI